MYSKRVSFCNSPFFKLLTLASIPSSSLCKYWTHLCSIRPERLHSLSDTRRWMASRNPQRCLQAAVLSISLSAPQTQNTIRSQTRRRCEVFLKNQLDGIYVQTIMSAQSCRKFSGLFSPVHLWALDAPPPSPSSPSSPSSSWSSVPSICHRQMKMKLCPRFHRDRRVTESCATRERVMLMNFSSACCRRSK